MLPDRDLLAIELDTLWVRDSRGRLVRDGGLIGSPAPHCVIASCPGGIAGWAIGASVPEAVVSDLERLLLSAEPADDPAHPPPVLAACRDLLASALGTVDVSSGPSYVAEQAPRFTSTAVISTSEGAGSDPLGPPPEEARWTAEEWSALKSGELGPWAVGLIDGQIVAICFCARLTDRAAEAGVWTDPRHRGQGHAAAVTAAWASQVRATGRYAFYSTSADNLSSQRVAARLSLRPIGWIWQIRASPP